jgi:hypothetical protein
MFSNNRMKNITITTRAQIIVYLRRKKNRYDRRKIQQNFQWLQKNAFTVHQ